jgi:hypothetical protein
MPPTDRRPAATRGRRAAPWRAVSAGLLLLCVALAAWLGQPVLIAAVCPALEARAYVPYQELQMAVAAAEGDQPLDNQTRSDLIGLLGQLAVEQRDRAKLGLVK